MHLDVGNNTKLLPYPVKRARRMGPRKIVNAPVECEPVARPRGADAARRCVHFENAGSIPIRLRIAACGQAADAGANDEDGFLVHIRAPRSTRGVWSKRGSDSLTQVNDRGSCRLLHALGWDRVKELVANDSCA